MNVLFLIFNRPQETAEVFEAIRIARPEKLFVSADGPRVNKPGEKELCEEARKITENIDWPCEVKRNYRNTNLGCKVAVSSAINWFFENVEEGIILEDDCQPDPSFFDFASSMLGKYRDNEKVMHISGSNFQFGKVRGDGSYFFSRSPHVWGWATWKRAWEKYDVEMEDLTDYIASKKIYALFEKRKVAEFWISLFKHMKKKNIDTWDAQWTYAIMKSEGLAINPNKNLVKNIGNNNNATHTSEDDLSFNRPIDHLEKIIDPSTIDANLEADTYLAETMYIRPWYRKFLTFIK